MLRGAATSGTGVRPRSRPFRIAVLGRFSVGKTSLCRRFNNQAFAVSEQPTIVLDFYAFASVRLAGGGPTVSLEIYDTAGQERFADVIGMTLRAIDGALVVYALDDANSLATAQDYVARVRAHDAGVPVVLVGNKLDLVDADACVVAYALEHGDGDGGDGDTGAPGTEAAGAGTEAAAEPPRATDLALNWRPSGSQAHAAPAPVTLNVGAPPTTYAEAAAVMYGSVWRGAGAGAEASDDACYNTHSHSYRADSTSSDDDGARSSSDGDGDDGGDNGAAAVVHGTAPEVLPWAARRRGRAVARDDVCAYAQRNALAYVETSALANTSVLGAFHLLAERIAARPRPASAAGQHGGTTDAVALSAARQQAGTDRELAAIERALAQPAPPERGGCAC